jgi:eukaryotic-like serine/threonine-protein kinase
MTERTDDPLDPKLSPKVAPSPPPTGAREQPATHHDTPPNLGDLAATDRLTGPAEPQEIYSRVNDKSPTPLAPWQQIATNVVFPEVGTRFLHFELVESINSGAFARVYLARQESLANRLVILKLTTHHSREPQNLARLRHTNIVPVYSVHEPEPFQVLCMPYLGRMTLGKAITALMASGKLPVTGHELLELLGAGEAVDHPRLHMNYVDGCLWVIGQLASGLAHAHARGILHRDVKPANILITEDGVPMILDFNVASEVGDRGPETPVGGTVPYMAPEHLEAFLGEAAPVDERSDLFSLGVILYEILTGQSPFPITILPDRTESLYRMIAQRYIAPVPMPLRNPAVSPAVEAIVARLLAPLPEDRYPSGESLCEDIARQLSNRPLIFAPDRSVRERAWKWRRRHPRLATGFAVMFAMLFLLVLPAGIIASRQARLAERTHLAELSELATTADATIAALHAAAVHLGAQVEDSTRDQGMKAVRPLIARYQVTDPDWKSLPDFALLDAGRQAMLTSAFAEVLVLMTRAEAAAGGYSHEAVTAGLEWNKLAATLFSPEVRPAVLDRHRVELEARLAGRPTPPPATQSDRDSDLYFDGVDLAAAHQHARALPLLVNFCDKHPSHFRAWFARGVCHGALGQHADAAAAFIACLALLPDSPDVWLRLGIARRGQKRYPEAETSFTRALELKPHWTLALMNRGIAHLDERKFRDAEVDFTTALAEPDAPTRLHFLRSLARRGTGDTAGADADRADGLKLEPTDAVSWAVRGRWKMATEPEKAIADFDAALRLDPAQRDALANKSAVLAEQLHRETEAVPVLDRLLELYPNNVDARANRGVYLARVGRAEDAKRDAADCLAADVSALRMYQIAGLYAQLAKTDPMSKDESLRLLAKALRAGFDNMKLLMEDANLDSIRKDPAFQRLIDAAKQFTSK